MSLVVVKTSGKLRLENFDSGITYIFNKQGFLNTKIFGEAKLEKLLSELKKNPGGPERRVSGL